jgi:ABC-2 type transport system permease protein
VITVTRIELLKIRTTRAPFGLLAAAMGITALIAALEAARAGGKFTPPLSSSAGLSFVLTVTGFALLMALVFGVTVTSGEFRHGTATITYLGIPRRARVLAAKVAASFGCGLVFGAAGAATATAVGHLRRHLRPEPPPHDGGRAEESFRGLVQAGPMR